MKSRMIHLIFGALALGFALLGLFITLGDGAFADPNRKPATQDSDSGLKHHNLGF